MVAAIQEGLKEGTRRNSSLAHPIILPLSSNMAVVAADMGVEVEDISIRVGW